MYGNCRGSWGWISILEIGQNVFLINGEKSMQGRCVQRGLVQITGMIWPVDP